MKLCCIVIFCLVLCTAYGNYTPCTNIYGKIAHPKECQLYYDCGRPGSGVGRVFEPNLYECEYPDLFDAKKLECNDYHYVDCGGRRVIKDICETKKFRDAHAHGRPCHVDHLNCDGLPDGKHQFQQLLHSPYYAECLNGRFMGKYMCKNKSGQPIPFYTGSTQCFENDDN